MSTRTQYFKLRGGILNERNKKVFIVLITSALMERLGQQLYIHPKLVGSEKRLPKHFKC